MSTETALDPELNLQLTRVYVALTLSRNVAGQLAGQNPADKTVRSLTTLLAVTSQMLEKLLDPTTPIGPRAEETPLELSQLM